jgi:nitroreductase
MVVAGPELIGSSFTNDAIVRRGSKIEVSIGESVGCVMLPDRCDIYYVRTRTAVLTLPEMPDMNATVLEFLLNRRSSKPALMSEPGPDADQLRQILSAAARVPDHKKLVPWRFIVFEGDSRAAFGARLAEICAAEEAEMPSEIRLQTERERLLRAPLVVAVISRLARPSSVPEIEQTLSAGAACMNLCLAANALGYATSWITEWYSFSKSVHKVLGLAENEAVAGFIYIGTASEKQPDRDRPDLAAITQHWPVT